VIDKLMHTVASSTTVADEIHDFGLMIGNNQDDIRVQISDFATILSESVGL
jgi:hypothetical protein